MSQQRSKHALQFRSDTRTKNAKEKWQAKTVYKEHFDCRIWTVKLWMKCEQRNSLQCVFICINHQLMNTWTVTSINFCIETCGHSKHYSSLKMTFETMYFEAHIVVFALEFIHKFLILNALCFQLFIALHLEKTAQHTFLVQSIYARFFLFAMNISSVFCCCYCCYIRHMSNRSLRKRMYCKLNCTTARSLEYWSIYTQKAFDRTRDDVRDKSAQNIRAPKKNLFSHSHSINDSPFASMSICLCTFIHFIRLFKRNTMEQMEFSTFYIAFNRFACVWYINRLTRSTHSNQLNWYWLVLCWKQSSNDMEQMEQLTKAQTIVKTVLNVQLF